MKDLYFFDTVSAEDVSKMLLEGSVDCIVLHKRGLYCAGRVSTILQSMCT